MQPHTESTSTQKYTQAWAHRHRQTVHTFSFFLIIIHFELYQTIWLVMHMLYRLATLIVYFWVSRHKHNLRMQWHAQTQVAGIRYQVLSQGRREFVRVQTARAAWNNSYSSISKVRPSLQLRTPVAVSALPQLSCNTPLKWQLSLLSAIYIYFKTYWRSELSRRTNTTILLQLRSDNMADATPVSVL